MLQDVHWMKNHVCNNCIFLHTKCRVRNRKFTPTHKTSTVQMSTFGNVLCVTLWKMAVDCARRRRFTSHAYVNFGCLLDQEITFNLIFLLWKHFMSLETFVSHSSWLVRNRSDGLQFGRTGSDFFGNMRNKKYVRGNIDGKCFGERKGMFAANVHFSDSKLFIH